MQWRSILLLLKGKYPYTIVMMDAYGKQGQGFK